MVHSIRALCQNTGGARQLNSLRRPPSTTEKRTFQLCLDTRIDITAPLGDDRFDTTAHSCSAVASAATSTVHHSVATSDLRKLNLRTVRAYLRKEDFQLFWAGRSPTPGRKFLALGAAAPGVHACQRWGKWRSCCASTVRWC